MTFQKEDSKMPKGWSTLGLITGPKGFYYAYGRYPFTVQRMGKNVRHIGADWRAFAGSFHAARLLTTQRFKTAHEAARWVDDLEKAIMPSLLGVVRVELSLGDHKRVMG